MPTDEQQRDHYDRLMAEQRPSRGFDCGFDTRFDPFLLDSRPDLVPEFESILRTAFPDGTGRLLDIGCGSGLYFPLLAPMAKQLVGVDISSGMIGAAQTLAEKKGLANVELRVASALELPFDDASFDSVLGFDVLHHVPDVDAAVAEAARVLRPGGRFVSIEPNALNPIVFLAHALPKEERGALRRNYPWKLRRLVRRHVGRPRSRYLWHVTSSGNKLMVAVLRFLDVTMQFWPARLFSIRMLISAEKR